MFERFDSNESGKINLVTLAELFNAKNHYDVKSGRKTWESEHQILSSVNFELNLGEEFHYIGNNCA